MSKENKVEYERVDEEGDNFRRILAKFNPHFLRKADIEIEFIPIVDARRLGEDFVSRIDSFSTIDLYRWAVRHETITYGLGGWKRGYIPPIKHNRSRAKDHVELLRMGKLELEPRQVISRVKEQYKAVADALNSNTAFLWNYFLFSGRLGSFPPTTHYFSISRLREYVEEYQYGAKNSSGEWVERSLAEHLFDTHKNKNIISPLLYFLAVMNREAGELIEKAEKEMRKEGH